MTFPTTIESETTIGHFTIAVSSLHGISPPIQAFESFQYPQLVVLSITNALVSKKVAIQAINSKNRKKAFIICLLIHANLRSNYEHNIHNYVHCFRNYQYNFIFLYMRIILIIIYINKHLQFLDSIMMR